MSSLSIYAESFSMNQYMLIKYHDLPLNLTGELVSININRYKCGYCGACVGVCPKGALELVETWIEVDESVCIVCGICDRICPVGAIEVMK